MASSSMVLLGCHFLRSYAHAFCRHYDILLELFINVLLESCTVSSAVNNSVARARIPGLQVRSKYYSQLFLCLPTGPLGTPNLSSSRWPLPYSYKPAWSPPVRRGRYPGLPSLPLRLLNSNGESGFSVRARVLSVCIRDTEFWYSDGNVVIRAETPLFKLHCRTIARTSGSCSPRRRTPPWPGAALSMVVQSIACQPTSHHTPSSSS